MEIKGRDPATECYRVVMTVDGREVTALVPERLAADLETLQRKLVGADTAPVVKQNYLPVPIQ